MNSRVTLSDAAAAAFSNVWRLSIRDRLFLFRIDRPSVIVRVCLSHTPRRHSTTTQGFCLAILFLSHLDWTRLREEIRQSGNRDGNAFSRSSSSRCCRNRWPVSQ